MAAPTRLLALAHTAVGWTTESITQQRCGQSLVVTQRSVHQPLSEV